jgi:[acyl-carrier-protein] S-malonyltransferase
MTAPAFLFPGQLSEFVGMARELVEDDSKGEGLLARTSERCGRDLERIILSGPEAQLRENLAAQASVFCVSTLAARALAREGLRPAATAGYSLGNYAAMVASGGVSYDDALEVLIAVFRETERLGIRGAMGAVVGVRRDAVDEVCERLSAAGKPVAVGNVNANTQFVLTGRADAVAEALEVLGPKSLSVLPLTMNWPIHSMLMEPVARAVAPVVEGLASIRDPLVPFYGPDGRRARTGQDLRRLLATEFIHPTLWNATVAALIEDGYRSFLEVGPGEMLTRMLRWIDRSASCRPAGTLSAIRAAADIIAPA